MRCFFCLLWLVRFDGFPVLHAQHQEYSADCHGEWDRCDRACLQVFTVYSGAQGRGAPCPVEDGTLRSCGPGIGNCPATKHSSESTSGEQQHALSIEDPRGRMPYIWGFVLVACVATTSAVYVEHCRHGAHTHANSTTVTEHPNRAWNALPYCSGGSIGCLKVDNQMDNQFFDNPARASAISVESSSVGVGARESADVALGELANTFEVELE